MCGIAGYSCSPEFVNKLPDNFAKPICAETWIRNLHRGTDAHGYMVSYTEDVEQEHDNGLYVFKNKGLAYDSIDRDNLPSGKPVNLGVHTRALTTGSREVPANNHPVRWGRAVVIHNGSVHNDKDVKNAYGYQHSGELDDNKVPTVDSVALAMILSEIDNPYDLEEVATCIDDMGDIVSGKYAFHAMFTNAPGLSLIVRGIDKPLVVAYDEENSIFMYGSEVDSVDYMVKSFELDEKDLEIGALDEGVAILLDRGEPIMWKNFAVRKWTHQGASYNKPDTERIGPNGEVLYVSTENYHWSKDNEIPLSLTEVKDWDRVFWLHEPDEWPDIFKNAGSNTPFKKFMSHMFHYFDSGCFYASDKTINLNSKWTRYFLYKDKTEFVFNDSFTLLDVYDWEALGIDVSPWRTINKEPETEPKNFRDWLFKKTTFAKLREVSRKSREEWEKFVANEEKKTKVVKKNVQPVKQTKSDGVKTAISGKSMDNPRLFDDEESRKSLVRSSHSDGYVFLNDPVCGNHSNRHFSGHEHPRDCPLAYMQAKLVLASCKDLDTFQIVYPCVTITIDKDKISECVEKGLEHDWVVYASQLIGLGESKLASFPVAENCARPNCVASRKAHNMPDVALDAITEWREAVEKENAS